MLIEPLNSFQQPNDADNSRLDLELLFVNLLVAKLEVLLGGSDRDPCDAEWCREQASLLANRLSFSYDGYLDVVAECLVSDYVIPSHSAFLSRARVLPKPTSSKRVRA